jgi:hypothetical protein
MSTSPKDLLNNLLNYHLGRIRIRRKKQDPDPDQHQAKNQDPDPHQGDADPKTAFTTFLKHRGS